MNIEEINIEDEYYPENLRKAYDPPKKLYAMGDKKILNEFSLAIIGSRFCSDYGAQVSKEFAFNLSKHNINIISGLAKGCDSCAHVGSIKACGKTIAVIGSGLDYIYPPENKSLYNKIIASGGVIISEYPLGTPPLKRNFPARNRIISGISEGIIVIEAQQKSGTFITVDFALEQGKNIFVIPRKHLF